ncbi:cation transport protein-domain-containing protein [Podospora appendiculata]|uniref:Potassium transport protein n=1 Tax=Podospora appendiculata TaxID=314037 RepID=A0AAE0X1D1_9PEZI|nr:cation transport protein-domain-containing protein [Podospora appendiculata]
MENLRGMVAEQLTALRPSFLSKNPHFNFISVHYFWIIGLTLLGSIVIYFSNTSIGELAYIDALFFASGANTQAGLNPVDLSTLNTFQQVVIYLMAMMSNPITINLSVVFLRLYWFEKRFQNIVREARLRRGTMSKSKGKTNTETDAERGVNGRSITVMHSGHKSRITNDGILLDGAGHGDKGSRSPVPQDDRVDFGVDFGARANGDADADTEDADPYEVRRQPGIKFAATVTRSDGLGDNAAKLPPMRPDQEHIAILERQRKRDDEVLRIPGPRDAERGIGPERVRRESDEEPGLLSPPNLDGPSQSPHSDRRSHQAITIEEPDRRLIKEPPTEQKIVDSAKAATHVFSLFKIRMPRIFSRRDQKLHSEEDEIHVTPSRMRRASLHTLRTAFSRDKEDGTPYLSWEPTIGRNSAFPDLNEEQREELGGIEYRSLKTLALILCFYFWGFTAFGVVCLLPWILNVDRWGDIVSEIPQSKVWWGFFTPNSAFTDLGYTLTADSMNSFNTAIFPLLVMIFLIIIGNTGFPIMLRFIIWIMSIVVPRETGLYEEVRFLLDHPRRCFTLLFPSGATWWLFWILVILNGLDVMFFIVLDLGTSQLTDLSPGFKFLNGFFEAASTRTAGFSCVNLALLHPAVQVSYMIMMYISVFPIAISVRRTNVYEEQSLGIYGHDKDDIDDQANYTDLSYVGAHLRRQLSFDLWLIFVAYFILAISEGPRIGNGPDDISMFAILFEIVSAYGTVGMSLGYPTVNASLCSQFSVVGKLVIVACMIRGRHRGLPYALDKAIMLPKEDPGVKEEAEADAMVRTMSRASGRSGGVLSSLLHPGPPMSEIHRRTTEPGSSSHAEDPGPYSSRVTHRRTMTIFSSQRPRTADAHAG